MSELTREQARLVIDQILAESCGLTEVEMAGSMTSVIKKLAKARRMAADSTTVSVFRTSSWFADHANDSQSRQEDVFQGVTFFVGNDPKC